MEIIETNFEPDGGGKARGDKKNRRLRRVKTPEGEGARFLLTRNDVDTCLKNSVGMLFFIFSRKGRGSFLVVLFLKGDGHHHEFVQVFFLFFACWRGLFLSLLLSCCGCVVGCFFLLLVVEIVIINNKEIG